MGFVTLLEHGFQGSIFPIGLEGCLVDSEIAHGKKVEQGFNVQNYQKIKSGIGFKTFPECVFQTHKLLLKYKS